MKWYFGMTDEKAKAFEDRRRKGMKMLKRGVSQAEVARALDVSRQTTSRWAKMVTDDPEVWSEKKRGRPAGLTDKQMRQLEMLVCLGPSANRFATYAWSVALVTELIEREFGVQYKAANVRRILRAMGLYKWRSVHVEAARRAGGWTGRGRRPR